jgi:hypothetical protein
MAEPSRPRSCHACRPEQRHQLRQGPCRPSHRLPTDSRQVANAFATEPCPIRRPRLCPRTAFFVNTGCDERQFGQSCAVGIFDRPYEQLVASPNTSAEPARPLTDLVAWDGSCASGMELTALTRPRTQILSLPGNFLAGGLPNWGGRAFSVKCTLRPTIPRDAAIGAKSWPQPSIDLRHGRTESTTLLRLEFGVRHQGASGFRKPPVDLAPHIGQAARHAQNPRHHLFC